MLLKDSLSAAGMVGGTAVQFTVSVQRLSGKGFVQTGCNSASDCVSSEVYVYVYGPCLSVWQAPCATVEPC